MINVPSSFLSSMLILGGAKAPRKRAPAVPRKRLDGGAVDDVFLLKASTTVAKEGGMFEGCVFCVLESDFTLDEEGLATLKGMESSCSSSGIDSTAGAGAAAGSEKLPPLTIKKSYSRDEVSIC
jgi:hypothetical protein